MQIPILNGIYTDLSSDINVLYPINMEPIVNESGISAGYLRVADGVVQMGTGQGIDRGGVNWNGVCYRVMGSSLIKVLENGATQFIGNVSNDIYNSLVSFDYGFDRLAIASNNFLYYYDGNTITQVTDNDIGLVKDVVWVDGYFMTTDGTSLVVTDLNNPSQVNPLKYGSSEVDPDPVVALIKLRNEVYALNRYTIEVFDNVGGSLFPFQRIDGAQITKGCVGTHACCEFLDSIAFLGGGKNEPVSVYIGQNGAARKISTPEIDKFIKIYNESILSKVKMESRIDESRNLLYIHLPDLTLVYDAYASSLLQSSVWFTLQTGLGDYQRYRCFNFVWCYNKWIVGDPLSDKIGTLSRDVKAHWGIDVKWVFGTKIVYNEGMGAIFNSLELVCLTGRVDLGKDCSITTTFSNDGMTWSQEQPIKVGKIGDRLKRIIWFKQGSMRNWRIHKFMGNSLANISVIRLEANIEPLVN